MRKLMLLLGLVAPVCALAQSNYLTITTSQGIVDASGAPMAQGLFCAYATDGSDNPIPFQIGATAQAVKSTICRNIVAGNLASTLQLANPAVTQPLNLLYHINITNTVTHQVTQYPRVSIVSSGSTWDWSNWNPATGISSIPVNVIVGPTGPVGPQGASAITGMTGDGAGNASLTGAFTVGSLVPANYSAAQQTLYNAAAISGVGSIPCVGLIPSNSSAQNTTALQNCFNNMTSHTNIQLPDSCTFGGPIKVNGPLIVRTGEVSGNGGYFSYSNCPTILQENNPLAEATLEANGGYGLSMYQPPYIHDLKITSTVDTWGAGIMSCVAGSNGYCSQGSTLYSNSAGTGVKILRVGIWNHAIAFANFGMDRGEIHQSYFVAATTSTGLPQAIGTGGACTATPILTLNVAAGALGTTATVFQAGAGCGTGTGVTWSIVGGGSTPGTQGVPGTASITPTWSGGALSSATVAPGTSSGYGAGTGVPLVTVDGEGANSWIVDGLAASCGVQGSNTPIASAVYFQNLGLGNNISIGETNACPTQVIIGGLRGGFATANVTLADFENAKSAAILNAGVMTVNIQGTETPITSATGPVITNAGSGVLNVNVAGSGLSGGNPLTTPAGFTVTPVTGTGSLAAATYYYKLAATNTATPAWTNHTDSTLEQVCVLVSTGECTLNWTAVSNATGYLISRSTSSGAELMGPVVSGQATVTWNDAGGNTFSGQVSYNNSTAQPFIGNFTSVYGSETCTVTNRGGGAATFGLVQQNYYGEQWKCNPFSVYSDNSLPSAAEYDRLVLRWVAGRSGIANDDLYAIWRSSKGVYTSTPLLSPIVALLAVTTNAVPATNGINSSSGPLNFQANVYSTITTNSQSATLRLSNVVSNTAQSPTENLTLSPVANGNIAPIIGVDFTQAPGGVKNIMTVAGGTKFTESGCTTSSTVGGASAGTFTLSQNSCTAVITINGATGATAPSGWTCQAHDRTTPTVLIGGESSSTTTTASITIPAGAGTTDVISFSCIAY